MSNVSSLCPWPQGLSPWPWATSLVLDNVSLTQTLLSTVLEGCLSEEQGGFRKDRK